MFTYTSLGYQPNKRGITDIWITSLIIVSHTLLFTIRFQLLSINDWNDEFFFLINRLVFCYIILSSIVQLFWTPWSFKPRLNHLYINILSSTITVHLCPLCNCCWYFLCLLQFFPFLSLALLLFVLLIPY